MDDLIAFVKARLDEDETIAREAASVAGPDWTWKTLVPEGYDEPTDYITSVAGSFLMDTMGSIQAESPHVARHDPVRVLREVEAKRAIVDEVLKYEATIDGEWGCGHTEEQIAAGGCPEIQVPASLRSLAAVWSDHPDYRAEWR